MKYIGNSAPYYLYQFQRMDESGRKTSFCWSALFIPEFYFFYRKMWGWGALALAVSLIVSIPSLLSLMAALGIATALPLSASALSTLITVCGLRTGAFASPRACSVLPCSARARPGGCAP